MGSEPGRSPLGEGEEVPEPLGIETSRPLGELIGHGLEEDRRILDKRRTLRNVGIVVAVALALALPGWLLFRPHASPSTPTAALAPKPAAATESAPVAAPPPVVAPPQRALAPRPHVGSLARAAAPAPARRTQRHHRKLASHIAIHPLPRLIPPSDPPPSPLPRAVSGNLGVSQ